MSQLTVRAAEKLVARVRAAASANGQSMNEFVVRVLDAATDPSLASDAAVRIRERLVAAGLVAPTGQASGQGPDAEALAAARHRAGEGTALSDIVSSAR